MSSLRDDEAEGGSEEQTEETEETDEGHDVEPMEDDD